MKTTALMGIVLAVLFVCGCKTTGGGDQLRQERDALLSELGAKNDRIAVLEDQNQKLEKNLAEQQRVGKVLQREKMQRIEDAASIRQAVRAYIKEEMQDIREFSQDEALLDYVGGELIPRDQSGGTNLLLVDMKNLLPSAGTLLGAKALVNNPGELSFCVLRPQDTGALVVVWTSKPFSFAVPGPAAVTFETLVAVEQGDYIGVYAPGVVEVPYSRGTGDTRVAQGPIVVGQTIAPENLMRKDQRMYSFGVTGFFEGQPVEKRVSTVQASSGVKVTADFETGGLQGWTKTGTAFDFQPTFEDNPANRGRSQPSLHQGTYWIGTYEKRSNASMPAGQIQGDGPQGTLTSDPFTIQSSAISFLIGGGCNINIARVELLVDGEVVLKATGKCQETMNRVIWDVSQWEGSTAQIRVIDASSGGWGHINFDDLQGAF